MKILIYECCEFIQRAMKATLSQHDVTVVNEIVSADSGENLFAVEAFSGATIAINPSQYDLAFVDRQQTHDGESLQFVTALANAGLPCIGISVMPQSNDRIMTVARFALAKVIVIAALRSGFAKVEDFINLKSETMAALVQFEDSLLHQTTPAMALLHEQTEDFLKLHLKAVL